MLVLRTLRKNTVLGVATFSLHRPDDLDTYMLLSSYATFRFEPRALSLLIEALQ